ncbi:MAG TPA: hypothetical protein DHW61_16055 [Lachnoclostridium phytofermentans]|uniref:Uncharacterized protein n=1 Tax=Lachnoclostridium phytofermentans TaxID=66219 RepID=A0A3D2XAC6_9FIRM|nr:hypothetical protein [Lachnoclostridium sp.]HCL03894.1 hypothetical protein [Lachnoclostridium phytofermentans]
MEKMRVKDGTECNIINAAQNFVSMEQSPEEFVNTYSTFSESNLSMYQILDSDGNVCGIYENKYVIEATLKDGIATFVLGDVDIISKRVKELEESNNMLTECILEMSQVVYAN